MISCLVVNERVRCAKFGSLQINFKQYYFQLGPHKMTLCTAAQSLSSVIISMIDRIILILLFICAPFSFILVTRFNLRFSSCKT